MAKRSIPASRRAAFTLIELVVAMAIVAVLAVTLYAALRVAFRAKAGAEAAVEPGRTAAIALDLVGADLGSALAPNGVLAQSFEGVAGTDDRGRPGDDLQFFSVADAPLHAAANGEAKAVEYAVQTVPGDPAHNHLLVRRVTRNLLSPAAQPNPDVEVVCRGVGAFHLRYYDGSQWLAAWDSTQADNTLPAAVEVTLALDRPGGPAAEPDGTRCYRSVRIFPLACSTAAQDSQVNPNAAEGLP